MGMEIVDGVMDSRCLGTSVGFGASRAAARSVQSFVRVAGYTSVAYLGLHSPRQHDKCDITMRNEVKARKGAAWLVRAKMCELNQANSVQERN